MENRSLDFIADDSQAGFRLHRLEVLNWGTFHRQVWTIEPSGENALMTGDIGSGKSTLVDAITTLIVPHQKIIYNKAAGGEGKERTLYSYIRGEYKSEKDDLTQSAKAIYLRDENSYTVILGHFYNRGYEKGVTLAQVYWLKDSKKNPPRFYVVSENSLSIVKEFSDFGSEISDLKKRLKKTNGVDVVDHFNEYSVRFRHLFGIQHEQALNLFNQTVSMKSVGNLTDFVRNHMLEKSNVEARIEELRRNFENLNRAHEAVLKATKQIERLKPIVEKGRKHHDIQTSSTDKRCCRSALSAYFAQHEAEMRETKKTELTLKIKNTWHRIQKLKGEINSLRRKEDELRRSIDEHGGKRIKELEDQIERLEEERRRKLKKYEEYRKYAKELELREPSDDEAFYQNITEAKSSLHSLKQEIDNQQRTEVDMAVNLREIKKDHEQICSELESLRKNKSKIPMENLKIREEMARTLELEEKKLPFVGELLQVDENEEKWEGAVERLLHNFGLSILAPEEYYQKVSHYVDITHLRGRIVYYRVKENERKTERKQLPPKSLPHKLRIKPESHFYEWLEIQLAEKFNYICCDTLEEFRHYPYAITRNGQIRSGSKRHEKDDRRDIHDDKNYILGWSNESKVRAFNKKKSSVEQEGQRIADSLASLKKQQNELNRKRDTIRDLLKIENYEEILWQDTARKIQKLKDEKEKIEKSSEILQSLQSYLEETVKNRKDKEDKQNKLRMDMGSLARQCKENVRKTGEAKTLSDSIAQDKKAPLFKKLDAFCKECLPETPLTLLNLDRCGRELREFIQNKIDANEKKEKAISEKIVQSMNDYKHSFKAETSEVDASVEALVEYSSMLNNLEEQDLPRHEKTFKELLNEGTINGIAMFQNQLENEKKEIEEKIKIINSSLREIEYNPGTFIELVMDPTLDNEIRSFQQDIRQCLSHSMGSEEDLPYDETRFMQVKTIVDRFDGRENFVDLDRKWTRKVTDVRNWFNFSASERWFEDNKEKEYYPGSAGKSGGQKEKLAYTILASALAYQFGLEWGSVRSRTFRFVVIDEAFGKGSDESTRYGLELFKKLNLQILIATPLQKIHIIEDYIRAVHFVHNEDGSKSIIRNLTIEEYRKEKEQHLQLQQSVVNMG